MQANFGRPEFPENHKMKKATLLLRRGTPIACSVEVATRLPGGNMNIVGRHERRAATFTFQASLGVIHAILRTINPLRRTDAHFRVMLSQKVRSALDAIRIHLYYTSKSSLFVLDL
jgi:hypothetical protein